MIIFGLLLDLVLTYLYSELVEVIIWAGGLIVN